MKIAQIAPIIERVPPRKYGGTERVISALTEELVKRGHEVTLFASGDTVTGATLSSVCPQSLREAGITDERERVGWSLRHIGAAYSRAREFDIIHDHCGVFSLPTAQLSPTPVIQTMHGAFYEHNIHLFQELQNTHIVTISRNQGQGIDGVNNIDVVHNGLYMDHYPFSKKKENYLLYVGRITPLKGTHLAVQFARKLGLSLIIAAKLDPDQQPYFDKEIAPYLSQKIQWVGEVTETERNELMSKALCFIHPGLWREPFGLTLIEAMACGAPVVALNRGSIPEIILHGKTGFIAKDEDEMVKLIPQAFELDSMACRAHALSNFSAQSMTDKYQHLYATLARQQFRQEYVLEQKTQPRFFPSLSLPSLYSPT